MNTQSQPTCKERVNEQLRSRLYDLGKLFRAYQEGNEESIEDLGTFSEYGLSFDYVAPDTFDDQQEGYFRYQLSCGGPSDEFRFFVNCDLSLHRIEYWFMDWFDGANIILDGSAYNLLSEIYDFFNEVGCTQAEFDKTV